VSHLNHLWTLISELSEQLNVNRSLAVSLYGQADAVNVQAIHGKQGFVVRRFNLDKPKDVYENELERMNAAMIADNHALQRDNKQLNVLIKDYEQTLENVMSAFRNRARVVQEKELSLIRSFESRILALQDEDSKARLAVSTGQSESLARLSRSFRQFIRASGGEDADRQPPEQPEDFDAWSPNPDADWALEREIELARLERENMELRRMLGVEAQNSYAEITRPPTTVPSHDNRPLGALLGRVGSAGPYGTLKNVRQLS